MKRKTTVKAIRDLFGENIISVGYCEIQNLLSPYERMAYTCGIYGWNFDVYNIKGVAICTGYRGMPRGLDYDYKKLQELEKEACKIAHEGYTQDDYSKCREKIQSLMESFIEETNGGKK